MVLEKVEERKAVARTRRAKERMAVAAGARVPRGGHRVGPCVQRR